MSYDHKKIERKWQKEWEKQKLYKTPDKKRGADNFYALVEFPYPSGNLHTGHWYAFSVPDIFARKKRMEGKNVMYPIGFDAFGLPAENAAIQRGINPKKWTYENIDYMRRQLKSMGASFDWSREVITSDPEYYRWTQWLFLQFFKKGLAYQAETPVNWCPQDKTVLANEQVMGGCCDRCGAEVEQRNMKQWMLKITDYAERLLSGLEKLNWSESIKEAQRNWIGKSEGAEIEFKINPPLFPSPREGEENQYFKEEGKFGYHTTDPKTWRALQDRAREMRAHPTKAEEALWQSLRKNLTGFHFRRQHIIGKFIVDFVCLEKSLVVEVDGDIHDYQKNEDDERTEFLKLDGFRVIRSHNMEVLGNIKGVIEKIKAELKTLPLGEGLGGVIKVFTTRPDTLYGATYVVLAPEHELVEKLKAQISNVKEAEEYIKKSKKKTQLERQQDTTKTGIELKGIKAINPASKEEVPIWVADYVLMGYGTGAIMAVPQHDERDREFAEKFKLPIVDRPLADKDEVINKVGGKKVIQYRLRDWVVSRQRYWGAPIPIINCSKCGAVPVPEKDLPVLLPEIKDYLPTGEGKSPLAKAEKWVKVKCPTRLPDGQECGGAAERETDTLDTFVDSSWYFLRYCDPKNNKTFAGAGKIKSWLPTNLYYGGAEHTTMHLLYSRFWYKAMFDCGLIPSAVEGGDEPYIDRRNHGTILGPDGQKMSKSHGNVVDPDEYVEKFGADTVRMYLAFIGPYNEVGTYPWDPHGILGIRRFLDRVWALSTSKFFALNPQAGSDASQNLDVVRALHKTIKKVSKDIDEFKFNTAISALMVLLNVLEKSKITHPPTPSLTLREGAQGEGFFPIFLRLLAPFAPHLTEEIWSKLGNKTSIHLEPWPKYDPKFVEEETFQLIVQINGKVRDKFEVPANISQAAAERLTLEREKVKLALDNKKPRRVVFIPKRLINIVV